MDNAGQVGRRASATDLRERSVRVVADGQPLRQAARRCGVRVSAVKRSVVRQQATGSRAHTPRPGGPRTIGREQEALLLARLQAAPEATMWEHCAWWEEPQGQPLARGDAVAGAPPAGVDASTKTLAAVPCAASRSAPPGASAVAPQDPPRCVLVEASGTHTALTRLSGGAPHEGRASGSVPRPHGTNTTVGAALTPDGVPVRGTCGSSWRRRCGPGRW
jgi:transposase